MNDSLSAWRNFIAVRIRIRAVRNVFFIISLLSIILIRPSGPSKVSRWRLNPENLLLAREVLFSDEILSVLVNTQLVPSDKGNICIYNSGSTYCGVDGLTGNTNARKQNEKQEREELCYITFP